MFCGVWLFLLLIIWSGCDLNPGFFKIHRQIFESDIFLRPGLLRLFIYLIGNARYSDKPNTKYKSHGITIKKGQFLRSYRKIQEDLEYLENNAIKNYTLSRIKRNIEKLRKQDRIITEITPLGTLFTIVNYKKYQDLETENNETWNGDETTAERQRNSSGTIQKESRKKVVRKLTYEKAGDFEPPPLDKIKQRFINITDKKVNLVHTAKEKKYMRGFWSLVKNTVAKNKEYSDCWQVVDIIFTNSQNTFKQGGHGFSQTVNPDNFNALLNGDWQRQDQSNYLNEDEVNKMIENNGYDIEDFEYIEEDKYSLKV